MRRPSRRSTRLFVEGKKQKTLVAPSVFDDGGGGNGATFDNTDPEDVVLTAAPGVTSISARRDHVHAIDESIAPTWTGQHTFQHTGGIIVDQSAGDDAIITMQSSDVAHGMTSLVATDTYAVLEKGNDNQGGAGLTGYAEGVQAMLLSANIGLGTQGRNHSAVGAITIYVAEKSGTGTGAIDANDNLIAIRHEAAVGALTKMVIDAEGTIHFIPNEYGSDIDVDLVTVQVGGTPTLSWDESEDTFNWTHSQVVNGAVYLVELGADPTEPIEGQAVIWMSDGSGKGDDGDVMIASQAGGTTNYGTLFDHSGGSSW